MLNIIQYVAAHAARSNFDKMIPLSLTFYRDYRGVHREVLIYVTIIIISFYNLYT